MPIIKTEAYCPELQIMNDVQYPVSLNLIETVIYGLMTVTASCLVFYLFHFEPVIYTISLISENQWGEYFTSICYIISGILLIALLSRPARRVQKILWAFISSVVFFIGLEEINWGQEIFNFSTPSILFGANVQKEFSFHNLKYLHENYHTPVACILIGWLFISITTYFWFPRLKKLVHAFCLPTIPLHLITPFLVAPLFFLLYPVAKSDEIFELFLGIAVLLWASDLYIKRISPKLIRGIRPVIATCLMFIIAVGVSAVLTTKFPKNPGWRLNITASRDYPNFGMYKQADSLYEYIYSHPNYIRPETRINHAKMLIDMDKKNKSIVVLTDAVKMFQAYNPQYRKQSDYLRNFGTALMLLKQFDCANEKFNQAIIVDERQIRSVSNQNVEAKLRWSISKTLKARGDLSAAIDEAHRARSKANSAQLQKHLDMWIKSLKETKFQKATFSSLQTPQLRQVSTWQAGVVSPCRAR
jgi:hypothetical protein